MDFAKLKKQLSIEEDNRPAPYDDATGKTLKTGDTLRGNLTVAIGHNLNAHPLSQRVIDLIFDEDVAEHSADLDKYLPWWRDEDEVRQRALLDLCFNMGIGKLLKFDETLLHWRHGEYIDAALHLQKAPWFRQVGIRGPRVVHQVRTGTDPV